jgi:hypothetical protein
MIMALGPAMHRIVFGYFFVDALGIVRADAERFPRHAARASRPLPRSRKAVHIPGLIPRRATSGMASMPRLVHGRSLVSQFIGQEQGLWRGKLLLGLASKLLLLIDLHASCQLSVFELVANRG